MGDTFARELSRVAVGQLCQAVSLQNGDRFVGVQRSAIECFTDLLAKYIDDLGCQAASLAEHSGRTEANMIDVRCALADKRVSLTDLERWMATNELPFAKATIPDFPTRKEATVTPVAFGADPDVVHPLPDHVPAFLPSYPKRLVCEATEVVGEAESETTKRRKRNKMKRAVEGSLVRLAHGAQQIPEPKWGGASAVDEALTAAKQTPMQVPDVDVIMEGTSAAARPVASSAEGTFGVTPFRLDLHPKPAPQPRDVSAVEQRDKKRLKMERIMAVRHVEEKPVDGDGADGDDDDDDGGD